MKKLFTIVFMTVCSVAFSQEKYALVKTDPSPAKRVDSVNYNMSITIGIRPMDGIGGDFSKDITVEFSGDMPVKLADLKCQKAVADYILYINQ